MTRRALAVAVLTLAVLAVLGAGIGVAAAHATTRHAWRTCKPGHHLNRGPYVIVDNAWTGPSARHFCVHSAGLDISIDSNARPAGNVVAYPNIRTGAFWTDLGWHSGFPVRVTRIGQMTLHVASRGRAAGTWLTDADIWFRPRANWDRHGTFELVIANRWQGFGPAGGTGVIMPAMSCLPARCGPVFRAPARIGHVAYRASEWITRDPVTGYTWPILVFRQVHQTTTARIRISAFVWWARSHGHLPSGWWLGDVAYGTELWSDGKGLTDSMHLGGTVMISTLFYDVAVPVTALLVLIGIFRFLWWLFIGRFERKATHKSGAHTWPTFQTGAAPVAQKTKAALAPINLPGPAFPDAPLTANRVGELDLPGRGRGNSRSATPSAVVPAPAGQPIPLAALPAAADAIRRDNHAAHTLTNLASGNWTPRPVRELPPGWRDHGWATPPGMQSTLSDQGQEKWLRDFLVCPPEFVASLAEADKREFEQMLAGAS